MAGRLETETEPIAADPAVRAGKVAIDTACVPLGVVVTVPLIGCVVGKFETVTPPMAAVPAVSGGRVDIDTDCVPDGVVVTVPETGCVA